MRVYAVRVFVDDLATATHFYRDTLGLPVLWEADGAVGLDVGVQIIVEAVGPEADADDRALVGRFVGCSIEVEDIAAAFAELSSRGVAFIGPPEAQPWGGTLAHLRDPAGNVLTLVQVE